MLAKERKKIPSKEKMQKFNDWKESQKTEVEKQMEFTKNNVDLTNKKLYTTQIIQDPKTTAGYIYCYLWLYTTQIIQDPKTEISLELYGPKLYTTQIIQDPKTPQHLFRCYLKLYTTQIIQDPKTL